MISRLFFWICVIAIFVYALQNNWFSGINKIFNAVKSDVEYQQNLVIEADDEIDDSGILTIEKGEKKAVRRNALGTVYGR